MMFRDKATGDETALAPDVGAARVAARLAEPADWEARAMLRVEGWRGAGAASIHDIAAAAVSGWRLTGDAGDVLRPDYSDPAAVAAALREVVARLDREATAARERAARAKDDAETARAALVALTMEIGGQAAAGPSG